MLKTPEVLTKRFGIEPSAGAGRDIPRVLMAFKGTRPRRACKQCAARQSDAACRHTVTPGKAEFLSTAIPMIMAGALPEYGQTYKFHRQVTQEALAKSAGFKSRSTFTRRVSRFAALDPSWTPELKERARQRERDRAAGAGKQVRDRKRPDYAADAVLIGRQRQFAAPNRYGYVKPLEDVRVVEVEGKPVAKYYPPTLADLLEAAETSPYFDPDARGFKSYDSFKSVPRWAWDHRLPLTHHDRLVLTYYFMAGLGSRDVKGKLIGEIHPKQETMMHALGISIRTIYQANKRLEALGIIRVAHPKPEIVDGRYIRGPAKIIYLPIRTLTTDEANAERERYARALAAVRTQREQMRAADIHRALLTAWTGQEHSIRAFWNELRRQLLDAGLERADVNGLVPRPPE